MPKGIPSVGSWFRCNGFLGLVIAALISLLLFGSANAETISPAEDPCEALNQQAGYIQQLQHAYFEENTSIVSDTAYDALVRQYKTSQQQWPECGASLTARQVEPQRVNQAPPMGSLAKAYTVDALKAWLHQVSDTLTMPTDVIEWAVEPKLDGVAVSLIYRKGKLVAATTRGRHGNDGQDVLVTARHLRYVPQQLLAPMNDANVTIRGEALVLKDDFHQAQQQEPTLTTPRHATSGALLADDNGERVRRRGAMFIAYQAFFENSQVTPESHHQMLSRLDDAGLMVVPDPICRSVACVVATVANLTQQRLTLPYPMDGVVVKVNTFAQQQHLGWKHSSGDLPTPNWAVAYKFSNPTAKTVLRDIDWTLGRTGKLTPIAVFDAVTIGGTAITRASLHNIAHAQALDVRLGDTIVVEKAGDVIPQVVGVDVGQRPANTLPLTLPGGQTMATLKTEQQVDQLHHWVKTVGIQGLGKATLRQWIGKKLVTSIGDLYRLTPGQVTEFDLALRTRSLSAIGQLQGHPWVQWPVALEGLGLPQVGHTLAKRLSEVFLNMSALRQATVADLAKVEGIGPTTAHHIAESLRHAEMTNLIDDLIALEVVAP